MTSDQRKAIKSALEHYRIGVDKAWEEANESGYTNGNQEDTRQTLLNKAADEIGAVFSDPDCVCHRMPRIEETL